MATFMSDTRKTGVLNWLRGVPDPPPAKVFAALFLSDPGPTGMGNEATIGRVDVAFSAVSIDPTTHDASISNTAVLTWPEATIALGTVTHVALMSASEGGVVLYSGRLIDPRDIKPGDNIAIKVGKIIVIQQ